MKRNSNKAGSRGGRGGARGGRDRGRGRGGGRGGGRDRDNKSRKDEPAAGAADKGEKGDDNTQAGEKRKRAVEPDGGPHTGIRGAGVPAIMSSKKSKGSAEES